MNEGAERGGLEFGMDGRRGCAGTWVWVSPVLVTGGGGGFWYGWDVVGAEMQFCVCSKA
ncbi:MAG: hypothetical protein RI897_1459 [Verrucomicrobiota bacterium]|jgi:hypothetical protein